MNRLFSACNIKTDKNNYKRDRTVCKTWYSKNKSERKNKNNTLHQKQILLLTKNQKLKTLLITITKTQHSLLDFQIVVKPIL